jgi:hypothetical protein
MGRLVMSFRGLCMHLHHDKVNLPGGVKHRVVAVDADQTTLTLNWGTLPPHRSVAETAVEVTEALAAAHIPLEEQLVRMVSAHLSVVNSVGEDTLEFIGFIPKLTHFKSDTTLRPDILEDQDVPTSSDCYVDMRHGVVIEGRFAEGGQYTTWIVDTDGDPVVRYARKRDGDLHVSVVTLPSTPDHLTLSDGVPGSIVLANGTLDKSDESNDFVLHYLARAGGIPQSFDHPFPGEKPASPGIGTIRPHFAMTTSCSNSQYP